MQLRRTFLAALACGSLALASCGGDDGSADTTLENVTTLAPADAAAREQQALLTLQDLPAGFMVSPEQADESGDDASNSLSGAPDAVGLEDCDHLEGYRDMEAGAMVEFEHPEGRWIAHEVAYADEVATRAYMEIWQDHRTPECFRQLFEKSAVEGVAGDDGVVESTSLLRDSLEQDPDNVTFSGAVTVVSAVDPNIRGEMSIRFQIRRFGPAVSQLLTIETGATPTDFVALNTRIEQRVSAALSA